MNKNKVLGPFKDIVMTPTTDSKNSTLPSNAIKLSAQKTLIPSSSVSPCDTTLETGKEITLISLSGPSDDLQAFISQQTRLKTECSKVSEDHKKCSAPPVNVTPAFGSMSMNVLLEVSKALKADQISFKATIHAPEIPEQVIRCDSEDVSLEKSMISKLVHDQITHLTPQEESSIDYVNLTAIPDPEAIAPNSEALGSTDPRSISKHNDTLLQHGPETNTVSDSSMPEKLSVEEGTVVAPSPELENEATAKKIEEAAIPDVKEQSICKTPTKGSISVDENYPRRAGVISSISEAKIVNFPAIVGESVAEVRDNSKQSENPSEQNIESKRISSQQYLMCPVPPNTSEVTENVQSEGQSLDALEALAKSPEKSLKDEARIKNLPRLPSLKLCNQSSGGSMLMSPTFGGPLRFLSKINNATGQCREMLQPEDLASPCMEVCCSTISF